MKKLSVYLFLVLLFFSASAQKEDRDSLRNVIQHAKPDTNKVNALYDLSFSYINSFPDSVLLYGTQSLELAKKINFQKGIANGDYAVGAGNFRKGDIKKAQEYFEDCALITGKSGNKTLAIKAYLGLGNINYAVAKFDTAIYFYQKGVLVCEEIGDLSRLATLLNNIGNLHSQQKRNREATVAFKKSLAISYQLKDTGGLALAYSSLANIYRLMEVYDSARTCVDSALFMAEKVNDLFSKSLATATKGLIEFRLGHYDTALPYLRQSIHVFKSKGNKAEEAGLFVCLGDVYFRKNKIDSSLYYYLSAQKLAEEAGSNNYMLSTYKGLSESYSLKGDFKNAYAYQQKFLSAQNKFLDSLNIRKVTELNAKYESVSRQRRIDLLEKDKEIQTANAAREKTVRYFSFTGIILLVLFGAFTFYRFTQRKALSEKLTASLVELKGTQQQLIETERLAEQEKIRLRVSRDLHDDIGSTLSSINLLSRTAKKRMEEKDDEKLFASLEKIGERTQNTLDNMNDIIWSIKPGNDSLADALSRMREYASTVLEAAGINYSIDFPSDNEPVHLPLELKNNIFLIFKEAVNNLAKYSRCTQANMRLTIQQGKIRMLIEDNGVGFNIDSTHDGRGNGLNNMKRRAEESAASLIITSKNGKGTQVEFNAGI